jgi:hypothetical protein
LDPAEGQTIVADSLYLRVFDRDLHSDQPFRVIKRGTALEVRRVQLSGSLGSVSADLAVSGDSLGGLVNVDLQLPAQPDMLQLPAGLWPQSLRLRAVAADNDSFAVFLQTAGLQLGNRSHLSIVANVRATADSTHFRIDVVEPDGVVLASDGELPLDWSMRPLSFALRPDSLRFEATLHEFPVPDLSGDPRAARDFFDRSSTQAGAHLNGKVQLLGSLAEPRGHGYLTVQPQDPNLQEYKAHLFLAMAQQGRPWSRSLQQQLDQLATRDLLTAPGAKMAVWLQRDSVSVLDAAAHIPVAIGFEN